MKSFHRLSNIHKLISADYKRYYNHDDSIIIIILKALFVINHRFSYQFWMRLGSQETIFKKISLIMWYRLSRKYCIEIPVDTKIGRGFKMAHGYGIVINHGTVIGENCTVSHFVSIGTNHNTPATIGDNVYIGPNVSVVENVKIGNNVKIGAGTVVINDIPDGATSVGNPNKIIQK